MILMLSLQDYDIDTFYKIMILTLAIRLQSSIMILTLAIRLWY